MDVSVSFCTTQRLMRSFPMPCWSHTNFLVTSWHPQYIFAGEFYTPQTNPEIFVVWNAIGWSPQTVDFSGPHFWIAVQWRFRTSSNGESVAQVVRKLSPNSGTAPFFRQNDRTWDPRLRPPTWAMNQRPPTEVGEKLGKAGKLIGSICSKTTNLYKFIYYTFYECRNCIWELQPHRNDDEWLVWRHLWAQRGFVPCFSGWARAHTHTFFSGSPWIVPKLVPNSSIGT